MSTELDPTCTQTGRWYLTNGTDCPYRWCEGCGGLQIGRNREAIEQAIDYPLDFADGRLAAGEKDYR